MFPKLTFRVLALRQSEALKAFYACQFTSSTQLIKPNYIVITPLSSLTIYLESSPVSSFLFKAIYASLISSSVRPLLYHQLHEQIHDNIPPSKDLRQPFQDLLQALSCLGAAFFSRLFLFKALTIEAHISKRYPRKLLVILKQCFQSLSVFPTISSPVLVVVTQSAMRLEKDVAY